MGDLVGIEGGKKGQKVIEIDLTIVECGNCEGALFSWKADENNSKLHIMSCAVCGYLFPIVESPESDVFGEFFDDE
jgi:hypothetical protein